jgi:hypothetical protein
MLTGGVLPIASSAAVFNSVLASKTTSGSRPDAAALPPLSKASPIGDGTAPQAFLAHAPDGPAKSDAVQAPASEGVFASSAANILNAIVSGYSTTVAGTQYLASLEQSGAEYTASVQSLMGATSTQSSELAAENNLNVRINELV